MDSPPSLILQLPWPDRKKVSISGGRFATVEDVPRRVRTAPPRSVVLDGRQQFLGLLAERSLERLLLDEFAQRRITLGRR